MFLAERFELDLSDASEAETAMVLRKRVMVKKLVVYKKQVMRYAGLPGLCLSVLAVCM